MWERVPSDAFAVFDTQDSGCISFGVVRHGRRIFVKVATTEGSRCSLRRAIAVHDAVRHPAIVRPIEVVNETDLVALTYPWVPGTVLNHATTAGSDRTGLRAFHDLPRRPALDALNTVLDAHRHVAMAGFVSVDLYDGCFLYDFDGSGMHVIDLDEYRPGPFTSAEDRLPGSARYMAPEEFVRGATIDERTTVFHLGRTITELLAPWPLNPAQQGVVDDATSHDPERRIPTVHGLIARWRAAAQERRPSGSE